MAEAEAILEIQIREPDAGKQPPERPATAPQPVSRGAPPPPATSAPTVQEPTAPTEIERPDLRAKAPSAADAGQPPPATSEPPTETFDEWFERFQRETAPEPKPRPDEELIDRMADESSRNVVQPPKPTLQLSPEDAEAMQFLTKQERADIEKYGPQLGRMLLDQVKEEIEQRRQQALERAVEHEKELQAKRDLRRQAQEILAEQERQRSAKLEGQPLEGFGELEVGRREEPFDLDAATRARIAEEDEKARKRRQREAVEDAARQLRPDLFPEEKTKGPQGPMPREREGFWGGVADFLDEMRRQRMPGSFGGLFSMARGAAHMFAGDGASLMGGMGGRGGGGGGGSGGGGDEPPDLPDDGHNLPLKFGTDTEDVPPEDPTRGMGSMLGKAAGPVAAAFAIKYAIDRAGTEMAAAIRGAGDAAASVASLDAGRATRQVIGFGESLGKLVPAVGFVAQQFGAVHDAAREVKGALMGTAEQLRAYSPEVARAFAFREVEQIMGDVRRAGLLGEPMSRFVAAETRLEETGKDALAILLKPILENVAVPLLERIANATERALPLVENTARGVDATFKVNAMIREAVWESAKSTNPAMRQLLEWIEEIWQAIVGPGEPPDAARDFIGEILGIADPAAAQGGGWFQHWRMQQQRQARARQFALP